MKKVVIVALSAVLAVMAIEPAHAQDQKVIAIIDSAIDSSKVPAVIYEACFTVSKTMGCPNGLTEMEGKGSANSPLWPSTQIGNLGKIYHGYNVAQAALTTNPNTKIVFIRMSGVAKTNGMQAADPKDSTSVARAIKWVSDNAAKYSIDAVSISQSWTTKAALSLCSDNSVNMNVSSLTAQNIPVFSATGNDGSSSLVGFPACVNGVIGVGAFDAKANILEKATNRGSDLDVVAPRLINIIRYNGTSVDFTATSAATPIAAALYVGSTSHSTADSFINSFTKVLGKYPYISK
jgi:hypothetical protein